MSGKKHRGGLEVVFFCARAKKPERIFIYDYRNTERRHFQQVKRKEKNNIKWKELVNERAEHAHSFQQKQSKAKPPVTFVDVYLNER